MSLSRNQLLFAGAFVIILFYFLYKADTMRQSSLVPGQVIAFKRNELQETAVYHPVIGFSGPSGTIAFWADSTLTDLSIGDSVQVIYRNDEPWKADVYSFESFWFGQTIYCIVPLAVWFAFVLSFIDKDGKTKLRLKMFEKNNSEKAKSLLPKK